MIEQRIKKLLLDLERKFHSGEIDEQTYEDFKKVYERKLQEIVSSPRREVFVKSVPEKSIEPVIKKRIDSVPKDILNYLKWKHELIEISAQRRDIFEELKRLEQQIESKRLDIDEIEKITTKIENINESLEDFDERIKYLKEKTAKRQLELMKIYDEIRTYEERLIKLENINVSQEIRDNLKEEYTKKLDSLRERIPEEKQRIETSITLLEDEITRHNEEKDIFVTRVKLGEISSERFETKDKLFNEKLEQLNKYITILQSDLLRHSVIPQLPRKEVEEPIKLPSSEEIEEPTKLHELEEVEGEQIGELETPKTIPFDVETLLGRNVKDSNAQFYGKVLNILNIPQHGPMLLIKSNKPSSSIRDIVDEKFVNSEIIEKEEEENITKKIQDHCLKEEIPILPEEVRLSFYRIVPIDLIKLDQENVLLTEEKLFTLPQIFRVECKDVVDVDGQHLGTGFSLNGKNSKITLEIYREIPEEIFELVIGFMALSELQLKEIQKIVSETLNIEMERGSCLSNLFRFLIEMGEFETIKQYEELKSTVDFLEVPFEEIEEIMESAVKLKKSYP